MQRAYISKLLELAEKDKNVLHLIADSGTGFDEMFRHNFPEQIFNFGIAEEHMVGAAAGLAASGKIPFVYTTGAFLAYHSLEFIRNDVCFQNLNVKIAGMGCGLSLSTLGPSHHTTEDVSVLRALPNLVLLSPATPRQVGACVEYAYRHEGPVYIKIGMNNEPEFFDEGYALSDEKPEILRGNGVCDSACTLRAGEAASGIMVFSTGSILAEAAAACGLLQEAGIEAAIVNVPVLKPFDRESIIRFAASSKLFFTVEEHNIYGGLGSIIAEVIAEEGLHVRLVRIGLNDTFAEGYGTYEEVRAMNGLDAQSIYRRIREEVR